MDQKIRTGAAQAALLAAAALAVPAPDAKDAVKDEDRPWWENPRGHGKGRLRKGTKPNLKKWTIRKEG